MFHLRVTLTILVLLLSGCKTTDPLTKLQKENKLSNYDVKLLKRAEELYSCGNFFKIVAKQRFISEEIKRYNKLSDSAKAIADNLVAKADGDTNNKDIELAKSFYNKGTISAIDMVKEIGRDRTGNKFNELTISCYSNLKKEEALDTVSALSKQLKNK